MPSVLDESGCRNFRQMGVEGGDRVGGPGSTDRNSSDSVFCVCFQSVTYLTELQRGSNGFI